MDSRFSRLMQRMEASVPNVHDTETAMRSQLVRIRSRAIMGRDVNGFPFLRKKDGSPSTLQKTGALLRSLQASAKEDETGVKGRVTVTGRAREYAPFVNAKRKFMGFSESDKRAIVEDLRATLRDRRRSG